MTASVAHLKFLVEDRSMELFLRSLLPQLHAAIAEVTSP